jgi:ribosomal protein L7Ae-like RNA K-turn-binding protein
VRERTESRREAEALGLLGLARRAGVVTRGIVATRRSMAADELGVVLFAADASETQLRKLRGLLRHRAVPVRWVSAKDLLGHALGDHELSVAGVGRGTFAKKLVERLPDEPPVGRAEQGPDFSGEDVVSDAGL